MTGSLRPVAVPFVAAAPAGARVRARLRLLPQDEAVLRVVGGHLGSLAGRDLAARCAEGRLDARGRARSWAVRKRALTAGSSSRWAGAITRTSEDQVRLAGQNLRADRASLQARIRRIQARMAVPAGGKSGRILGYPTAAERHAKAVRLRSLQARLARAERQLAGGTVPVVRGGKALLRMRGSLDAAGLTQARWRAQWESARLFLTADGDAAKAWGNETIRWHPEQGWLEIKLPAPLAHLANRPHGRYRLSCPVAFSYRGDQVAAQAASGAVRYDISCDPARGRWYIDASWKTAPAPAPSLDELRARPVVAVDVNHGHLAAAVIAADGNVLGVPATIPLALAGLPSATRDGHLRAAISALIATARARGARAIVIEDLDFAAARAEGRERAGNRPSRGRRGRDFRRLLSGIPTGKLRDRLVQMAANAGLSVIVVDAAYTSRWAAEHWLRPLREHHPEATGHHAAALVIGRRGLGHRARRRATGNRTAPEDAARPAQARPRTTPARRTAPRKPAAPPGPRQPPGTKTGRPHRTTAGNQAAQDRSGPPARKDHVLLAQQERLAGTGSASILSGVERLRSRPVARSFWFFRITGLLAMIALLGAAAGIGSGPADAASSPPPSAASGSWTVYHDDPAGNGVAPPVSAVDTTAAVWNSPALDGQIYGEPLIYAGRVYVATENDTVYALSAVTGAVAWSEHLGPPVPAGSLPCGNISPTVGITGTPVIDQARGEIFVVADELVSGKSAHRLVGLATASGRIEMTQDVDPPGADTAALLQRTGLTLDGGQVVFGMGGNYGDCASYQGRVAAVPETGGTTKYFTVDAAPGESQGAVWMGGAAPVVDGHGDIWVSTGNGSVYSDQHAYDNSDSVLELSPSLQLMQFFAPSTWATNNSQDLDMSIAPALLPDGQVVLAGKSRIVYLLNGAHLGGIGGQQATLGSACGQDIDGGVAVVGMTVYLPCLAGIIAVQATSSPAALHLLWSSGTGGGPPIAAAGLIWTMGQNGTLYGLDPATGRIRQQVTIGAPANHFPTPSVGDGLLLAASAEHVVAFAAPAPGARPAPATASPGLGASGQAQTAPAHTSRYLAAIVFVAAAVLIAIGWLVARRLRRAR